MDDTHATHAVMGNGYIAGGAVTITNTLSYTGTLTTLGLHVLLPTGLGWSYAGGGGSQGEVKPTVGTTELLDWGWTTVPPSPVTFTYTLNVPAGTSGAKNIVALMLSRRTGAEVQTITLPDPLVVNQALWHSADTNQDWKFNLSELLRVVQLFNYRSGTVRTGEYHLDAAGEDGFNPGP